MSLFRTWACGNWRGGPGPGGAGRSTGPGGAELSHPLAGPGVERVSGTSFKTDAFGVKVILTKKRELRAEPYYVFKTGLSFSS